MARPRNGTSPHTRYRRARERVSAFENQYAKLERTRPRARGKKSARTRALNELARRIGAARGQLTKARNAIAQGARTRAAVRLNARQKRREAAKRGWETRRVPKTAPDHGKVIPFVTMAGVVYVWPPAKSDRSKVGSYWNAIGTFLSTGSSASLDRFNGDSIYDEISEKRLPFVTDPAFIIAHNEEYDFGAGFYKRRSEAPRNAA
jgi:hypothetical protein